MSESDWCCGAAGTYNLTQPEMSTRLARRKLDNIARTGADTIASACPFCMRMLTDALNTRQRTDIAQLDIAEVLLISVTGA